MAKNTEYKINPTKVNGRDSITDGNKIFSGDDLVNMPHSELYTMRAKAKDKDTQNLLAKYEHRAFAREATRDNPLYGVGLAAAVPIYQTKKALGFTNSRSDASLPQMAQGFTGIG